MVTCGFLRHILPILMYIASHYSHRKNVKKIQTIKFEKNITDLLNMYHITFSTHLGRPVYSWLSHIITIVDLLLFVSYVNTVFHKDVLRCVRHLYIILL